MNYKSKLIKGYLSPEIEVVRVSLEGVLCQSGENYGITVNDMVVVDGGSGTKWEWE